MQQLLLLLRDICLLRRGPQDLPYSPALLLTVCAVTLLLQLAIAQLFGVGGDALLAGIIGIAFNLSVLHLVLTLRGLGGRFVQAALAWFGCAIFFTLLVLPVMLASGGRPLAPEQVTPLQGLLAMLALPIVAWKLIVDASILRHSLNVPFMAGLAAALLWVVAELALGGLLHDTGAGA